MIRSFADREAEALFHGRYVRRLAANIQRVAQRKLRQLHAAEELRDLAAPPGNRLEALRGARAGQYGIRISPGEGRDQWWLCFTWKDGGAEGVEITDYH
jgi:toxin HigB-1